MDRAALIAAMQEAAAAAATPKPVQLGKLGTLYVRQVTVGEVDEAQAAAKEDGGATKGKNLARAACRVLCDEAGARLFNDKDEADVALLSSIPWTLLQKALTAADADTEPGNA